MYISKLFNCTFYLGYFSGKFGDVMTTGDVPTVIRVTEEEQCARKQHLFFSNVHAIVKK